jgi:hypothetical protein
MAKSVKELIEEKLGVRVAIHENPLISSVGPSASKLFKANANRVLALVVNLSSNDMYLTPSPDPSPSKGIMLTNNGGALVLKISFCLLESGISWLLLLTQHYIL